MTCGRVVIINKGRVVAEDTPENLTHRLRGAAALRLEVRGEQGHVFDAIRAVPGVTAVQPKAGAGADVVSFEVEAEAGRDVRADLARAIVQSGHDLLTLSQVGMSLEDIFLHLTTAEPEAGEKAAEVKE